MATAEECERALRWFAARFAEVDPDVRRSHATDRDLSCHVRDLGIDFSGRLENGTIEHIVPQPNPGAQIKLTVDCDDLVALTERRLNLASAWSSGRLRIDASIFDLLKLRAMFSSP